MVIKDITRGCCHLKFMGLCLTFCGNATLEPQAYTSKRRILCTRAIIISVFSVFLGIAKLKCPLNLLVYISLEPEIHKKHRSQKIKTYQIVPTENKDSVYFIITALSRKFKGPFQIREKIFLKVIHVFSSLVVYFLSTAKRGR